MKTLIAVIFALLLLPLAAKAQTCVNATPYSNSIAGFSDAPPNSSIGPPTMRCVMPGVVQGIGASTASCAYTSCLRTNNLAFNEIVTEGYYGAGSDGGGTYVLKAGSCSDNGGSLMVDAAGHCYQRLNRTQMTAYDWGAKCDGSTDDTTQLTNEAAAGPVVIPYSASGCKVASNLTLTVAITFQTGGFLLPANGNTVTLQNEIIAGVQKICDLSLGGTCNLAAALANEVPVEWFGGGVGATGAQNAAAVTAAELGPYRITMMQPGTYTLTGIVMSGTAPHRLIGGGDGVTKVSCSGIAYAHAAQLTGTLLASDPVCFQNGVASGVSQGKWVFQDITIVASGASTIAVAIGDSTTQNMAEGWTCEDSSITGFVGVYWGNSNANVMNGCSVFGTAASGSYAELYERPNVPGLVGGAVQNVTHIGGLAQMPSAATGINIGMLDAGSSGAIGSIAYYGSRVEGETTVTSCVTSVASSGGKGLNWFENVGFENCGTSGSPVIYSGTGTLFTNPGAEGQNTVNQLINALSASDVLWESSFAYVGSAANPTTGGFGYVSNGAVVRLFSGTGSPTSNVTALGIGDTYFRVGAGATVANSTCKASAANNSSWYEVSVPATPC